MDLFRRIIQYVTQIQSKVDGKEYLVEMEEIGAHVA